MSEWNTETAEWYANKYGDYATNRLAVQALDLTPTADVVDVGCGTGSALRQASTVVKSGTLIGVDPVPRMVEIAREQTASHPGGASIEFREGSAERLPIADASADFVFAFDSFDHWEDKAAGLSEIRRVLRGDGQLAVVKDGGLPGAGSARDDLLAALSKAGFEVRQDERLSEAEVTCSLWLCGVTDRK